MPKQTKATRILVLKPIKPNYGAALRYQRELKTIFKAMVKNVNASVLSEYKLTTNVESLQGFINLQVDKWQSFIDHKADTMAISFVSNVDKNVQLSLTESLKSAPKFITDPLVVKMSNRSLNALNASNGAVIENVNLIKSVPSEYKSKIEFLVNQAAVQGRDISYLTKELMQLNDLPGKKAKGIARDQINKVTETISINRQKDLGITENQWHHSSRPKQPRKTHIEADGVIYNIYKGCPIKNEKGVIEYIFPAQKRFCYCYSSPVLRIEY